MPAGSQASIELDSATPPTRQFANDKTASLYAERSKRLADVIALRQPDRVPMIYNSAFWHATYSGITFRTAMYDYDALARAFGKAVHDLEPDAVSSPFGVTAIGPVLELLGFRAYEWPGHGLPDNRPYQYIDREYMTAAEYDLYLSEPNWFILTRYMPRIAEAFAPFAEIPTLDGTNNVRLMLRTPRFANKGFAKAFANLVEAGDEANKMAEKNNAFAAELQASGFPIAAAANSAAPYDYFADFFRGSKGIMLDLRRNPDKLLAAMDKVVPLLISDAVAAAKANGGNIVFIPLHWGLDAFMSPAQFKTFYWPPLRRVIMGLIEAGLVPMVFWEGDCTSRLEIIADIPPRTCIYQFERTDIFRAKEIMKDIVCVRGNVPPSMLIAGSVEEVRDYCRKLIDVVGKGGGFILEGATSVPNEARPENVFAMYEMAKTYGRYT
jgi:hypothetical protein